MTTWDFAQASQPKERYELRIQLEERHRQLQCFYDLSDFCAQGFHVIVAQVVFILLSFTLRQWQVWKQRQELLAGCTPEQMRRRLNVRKEFVVIYHQNPYTQMSLVTFSCELLELAPEARAKAREKLRRLEPSFLMPLEKLRPP